MDVNGGSLPRKRKAWRNPIMNSFNKIIETWRDYEASRADHLSIIAKNLPETSDWKIPWNHLEYIYRNFDGMDDDVYDKDLFSFWRFEKALSWSNLTKFKSRDLWPFGDYGYQLNIYAVRKFNDRKYGVIVVSDGAEFECAENLEVFFDYFSNSREKLHIFS
jgi:hypothetical protein